MYNENASIKQLLLGLPRARTQYSQNHYNTSSPIFLFKYKGSIKHDVCGFCAEVLWFARLLNFISQLKLWEECSWKEHMHVC